MPEALHQTTTQRRCATIELDATGTVRAWDDQAECMFGWRREQAIGRPLAAFLLPERLRASHAPLLAREAGATDRSALAFETSTLRRDGEELPVALCVAPMGCGAETRLLVTAIDLTEQERVRAAQERRESQYRMIFQTHPLPMWVFDLESRAFLAVNEAAVRHYGYSREEFLAMTILDLRPEEDLAAIEALSRSRTQASSNGLEAVGIWRHRRKDGAIIDVQVLWSSIHFDGRDAVLVLAEDVTDRQRAAHALARQAELLRLMGEIAGAANQAGSVEEALQFCLDRVCAEIGWPVGHALLLAPGSREELVSSRVWCLAEHGDPSHPGDRADALAEFRRVSESARFAGGTGFPGRVLTSGQPEWFEDLSAEEFLRGRVAAAAGLRSALAFPILAGSDVVGVLEFFAREPIRSDGQTPHVVSQLGLHLGRVIERERAALDLRQREERLSMVTDRMPAIIWTTDRRLRFTWATGAGLEPIDLPASWLLDHGIFELFQTADPEFLPIAMHRRALQGESVGYEVEFKEHTFAVNLEPIRGPAGAVTGCIGVALDVTERRVAEAELRRSREQLRELAHRLQSIREEEQRRIAREIHDELGQRLTALRLDLSWLASRLGRRPAELRERVEQMQRGADETMEKLRQVAAELRPTVLEDLGLAAAIEWLVQRFSSQTGIPCAIEGDLADDSVDRERAVAAYRILQEALTNVVRHAEARRVTVTARVGSGTLVLEVQDDGRGISPAEIGSARALGLAGMKERAIALGGSVSVAGTPGRGTRVRAVLPSGGGAEDGGTP
jgi:two-component system, NarL family, sensor histidine kinase UhpB